MHLKVFLGHRFVDHITQPLRFNLARILGSYGIKLIFAGQDSASEPLISDIIKKLSSAELALKLPSLIYQRVRPIKRSRRT